MIPEVKFGVRSTIGARKHSGAINQGEILKYVTERHQPQQLSYICIHAYAVYA